MQHKRNPLLVAAAALLAFSACSDDSDDPIVDAVDDTADSSDAADAAVDAPDAGDSTEPDTEPDTAPDTEPDTAPDTEPDTAPDTAPDVDPDADGGASCDAPNPSDACQACRCDGGAWTCDPINDGGACDVGDLCDVGGVCDAGVCLGGGPVDCDDSLDCTVDSCDPSDGACVNTIADDACVIDGACFADGDRSAEGCGVCAPETAQDAWSAPLSCSSYTVTTTGHANRAGFDVSDQGVTLASWTLSGLVATCLDNNGVEIGALSLFPTDPERSGGARALVARAEESEQSVVVAVLPGQVLTEGGPRVTDIRAWWLTPSCTIAAGPTTLPMTEAQISLGNAEWLDVAMADDGRTAIVYQTEPDRARTPTLVVYDGAGALVADAQHYGADVCNEAGHGLHVAMNEASGDILVSCQGHSWVPVRGQRFSPLGVPIDESMFEFTGANTSAWYDSHLVGMNRDGHFAALWNDSNNKRLSAAFFESDGEHVTDVSVGTSDGSWYDGYRNIDANVEALSDGSFLFPSGYDITDGVDLFAVYSAAGALVSETLLDAQPPLLRVGPDGALYAWSERTLTREVAPFQLLSDDD